MRVTFPHMGSTIIYKKLFELLGHEVISPPEPTQLTIDLGVKYSPEFACFPLKVILGSYLEAIEQGADTIVTSGGNGPCRAGYYGEVHKNIINDNLGLDIDFIIFDEPKRDYKGFIRNLKKVKGDNSYFKLGKVAYTVYKLSKSVDKIEKIIEKTRPYVCNKIKLSQLIDNIQQKFDTVQTVKDIKEVEKFALQELDQLDVEEIRDRYRIGIVGEIYVVMEPHINFGMVEMLNNFGIEVEKSHYISSWVDDNLLPFLSDEKEIVKKGEKYIEIIIGGHAKQSVGYIVDYKDRGFDGVIHLKPFGCLPELVTQSMLDNLSEKLDIPILSLSIDEQMAEANVQTRIEAFIDMIKQRKNKEVQSNNERYVSGY